MGSSFEELVARPNGEYESEYQYSNQKLWLVKFYKTQINAPTFPFLIDVCKIGSVRRDEDQILSLFVV